MVIELDAFFDHGAKIRVVGVGGGGGNAINSMIEKRLQGVDFFAINCDMQSLDRNKAPNKIQIGKNLTRGLGAGADPSIGQRAVEEDRDEITRAITGSDMVFVTAGMGGGTGTGGGPIVANIAKSVGALVVGIVTRPFTCEGKKRMSQADGGIEEMKKQVDTLIVIPNQKLLSIVERNTPLQEAFDRANDVLYNATRGISELITTPGLINVDFADVRTIMREMGDALMGSGVATGENRAIEAAHAAISSPLLEGVSISGALGILVNVTGGPTMSLVEVDEAVSVIHEAGGEEANVIMGAVIDENLGDEMMVTVIATGFNKRGAGGVRIPRQTAKVIERIPVGLQDLQRLEEPAFIRKGIDITVHPFKSDDLEERKPDHSADSEKPAFLRKIMD
ncbi:MAG: cell division protein FtsZ [Ignavibacteria bacterium 13_1_40CM_2_61_4]|nr:MAG: cell division protein FtsZ [Ignavibacteria bacterium 13_1_40CM_2_61_4]